MLIEIFYLIIGLIILVAGADALIKGATALARSFGVSTLIIGLTVVAFGTSAPELFVSLVAAWRGTADVAVGNVVGSNIFNILIVIGLAAAFSPITISNAVRTRELPIMTLALAIFWWMSSDYLLSRIEGILLFCCIIAYLLMNYFIVKHNKVVLPAISELDLELQEDAPSSTPALLKNTVMVILGLAGLVFGADLMVDSATYIAREMGVSELVIGITLIAVGTSLPELATTLVAAYRGEPELIVGNAIGSNIFNVLCVIGATAAVSRNALEVNPKALVLDFPFMFAASFIMLPLAWCLGKVHKVTGVIMVLSYAAYVYLTFVNQGGV
ncbi:MAG: sodium:calcium antiporter [Candidatus Dadabacteria bacterium]|nr:MAG: sodium:calcium antiporter [Candidatus Dadabacteria bacterium]